MIKEQVDKISMYMVDFNNTINHLDLIDTLQQQ